MAEWPVDVRAVGVATCGAVLWRMRGELHLTVVVKATFGLAPATDATLLPPDEILRKDRHYDKSPARSVEAASDLSPYRPRADVTLVGHAHAPPGRPVPTAAVRLAIFRDRALLDKTLYVFGDRPQPSLPPRPFDRIPLRWERTHGGPRTAANPVGVGESEGDPAPNVIDPRAPRAPAGFAPLSPYWPVRRQLAERPATAGGVLEIADAMRWPYFQAAPPDQQIEYLRGDEWIVLDGMHPSLPRLYSRLPRATAAAWVIGADRDRPRAAQPLDLVADGLAIDADRQRCSVTWRGGFVIADGDAGVRRLRIYGGVELPGRPVTWPTEVTSPPPPPPPPPPPSSPARVSPLEVDLEPTLPFQQSLRKPHPLESTATMTGRERRGVGAPFPLPEPAPTGPAPLRPPDIPGTPWGGEPAVPPPSPLGEDFDTMMFVRMPPPPAPPSLVVRGDPGHPVAAEPSWEPPALEPDGEEDTTTLKPPPTSSGDPGVDGGGSVG